MATSIKANIKRIAKYLLLDTFILIPLFIFLFLCSSITSNANTTDSLKLILHKNLNDSIRCKVLIDLIENTYDESVWEPYNNQLLLLCDKNLKENLSPSLKKKYLNFLSDGYNNLGALSLTKGDLKESLEHSKKSLLIQIEIKEMNGMAASLNNLGYIYRQLGESQKALSYYFLGLKIHRLVKNKGGEAFLLFNIGNIYEEQDQIPLALDYLYQSLKLREELNLKNEIAATLNNIALIHKNLGDFEKAIETFNNVMKYLEGSDDEGTLGTVFINLSTLEYKKGDFNKAMDFCKKGEEYFTKINSKEGIAASHSAMGNILIKLNDFKKAEDYFLEALVVREKIGNFEHIAQSYIKLAELYFITKEYKKSNLNASIAYSLADEHSFPQIVHTAAIYLMKTNKEKKNYKEALKYYELEIQLRDSLNNESNRKATIKKQFQYQYEKQAAADSVKNAEAQKVKNALLNAQAAQLKHEKTQRLALYGGLALVIIFAAFVFNRFKITQKQKTIIEAQKSDVDDAYHQLHEKNKEVMDSIKYAARIQKSLITNENYLRKFLNRKE